MKPTEGIYQTATQVKVISPEIFNVGKVDSVHLLEDSMMYIAKARDTSLSRGLRPWYGIGWKLQELGRACLFPGHTRIAANNPKRGGCDDDNQAVGLTHSRGVIDVTISEFRVRETLKGVSNST
jgi:hypothetical protein